MRNETISTDEPAARANVAAKTALPPHSGLFLIQFNGPIQPAWIEQLKERRVNLVRYVPDHAFIARASGVRLSELDQLPFVRWTGAFRPEHKIHNAARSSRAKSGDLAVSAVLAADADPQQLASARRLLNKVSSESASRFGRVWRGEMNAAQLNALAQSDAVLWIEAAPKMKLNDEVASKIVGGDSGGHATYVQALDYDGRGVAVSIADSGLHVGETNGMHPDLLGRVDAFFFYGDLDDASDEHSHGTHVTGIIAGDGATGEVDENGALWGLGVAPRAHVIAQRIFDGEGNYTLIEPFETLTRDAVTAGAVIGSNSWGDDTQGRYDISAMEFDALVRDADAITPGDQPYILEFSAGNAGPGGQTIGSPAVGKNVIATGASQNDRLDFFLYADGIEAMADFSSRGPCEDGRIKPDLVAPGTWIASLRSPLGNDDFAWGDISFNYLFQGGTSQAGPMVSGGAAVFVQYFRETHTNATPSPAMVKAALINSATDMDDEIETGPVPNMDEGWGRMDLTELIGSTRSYEFVDQSIALTTGQQFEKRVIVADSDEPLKITLAYTDVPGFPGALPALVNDLDLEVIAPNGSVYHGNQFLDGESVPDVPAFDEINNVEAVHIGEPAPGEYIIRVRARNVAQDARVDTLAVDQDFALVVSATIPAPGIGFVFFDRPAYSAPATINVKVIDADLAGGPSVNVTVSSTTQPSGLSLVLTAAGSFGSFTGSVATATNAVVNRLRISHNDTIRAEYLDVSPVATRSATARGDLLPPVITGVGTTSEFGRTVVNWTTDESANSIVRFGTNAVLSSAVTNRFFTQSHSVKLDDLIADRTYFFSVISEDEAGNRATNNNGGALFSFVAVGAPTVLLVNNYQNDDFEFGPDIPLSTYTAPLNAIGAKYDLWDIAGGRPSPTLTDLRPYRAVIWRVSDNVFINNTLSPAEQTTVQQYVQGGGSFFMASMEQLSRLGTTFRERVLQVVNFAVDDTAPAAVAVAGNLITAGMNLDLNYSDYDTEVYELFEVPPDISDTMTISTNAVPILHDGFGGIVGLAYPRPGTDSTGRVVFLSFPLDAVSDSAPAPNNRATLLRNILQFLAPGEQGVGSIALNNTEFTLPSLVTIEVADSDLAGAGQVSANISSTLEPAGLTVTLTETARRGIFRGAISLVRVHGGDPSSELRATNGNTIIASYFDASANSSVTFTGRVETVAPIISGVMSTPDYVDAIISWDTDELADALVQFGESPLLGRTAYTPTLEMNHEVSLTGLRPDRTYYYQVVSRDNAGNTVVDDNRGALYTFQTLRPIVPPWYDNLESGSDNWQVFTDDFSELGWELGPPQNPFGVTAHSGANAWGSNLKGEPVSLIETFLISPPIDLSGGNVATLRFWQNYDFSESDDDFLSIELGEVLLITNSAAAPIVLGEVSDFSDDWEEAQFDLTPHIGKLVYVVWHYVLFTFDNNRTLGWLVDDISVTVTNQARGVVRVTNNLSQASFIITGPASAAGQGNSFAMSNAPPGTYVVNFNAVPFYNTPARQTNSLQGSNTLVFVGTYTITDANTNGIADTWEQSYFGSVSPTRTQSTDTDSDGVTDYEEFAAGTNPTNSASRLRFLAPAPQVNSMLRLDWPTVPGRSYRVNGSDNLQTWTPLTDWMRANGALQSYTMPETNRALFFRLEVRP